jgi:DNA-binding CsgD family transcriptional regulator
MLNLQLLSNYMPEVFFWKKDRNSVFLESDNHFAKLSGLNTHQDICGLKDIDLPYNTPEAAARFREEDEKVISTGKSMKILAIEPFINKNWKILLGSKCPLQTENKEIEGTFAYFFDITETFSQLAHVLTNNIIQQAPELGFVRNSYIIEKSYSKIALTTRQSECLFLLLQGKTAKQIAKILSISYRTVEEHTNYLKNKFGCQNKSELIVRAIEQGFMNIIPQSLFTNKLSKMLTD